MNNEDKEFMEHNVEMIIEDGFKEPNTEKQLQALQKAIDFIFRHSKDKSSFTINLEDIIREDLIN